MKPRRLKNTLMGSIIRECKDMGKVDPARSPAQVYGGNPHHVWLTELPQRLQQIYVISDDAKKALAEHSRQHIIAMTRASAEFYGDMAANFEGGGSVETPSQELFERTVRAAERVACKANPVDKIDLGWRAILFDIELRNYMKTVRPPKAFRESGITDGSKIVFDVYNGWLVAPKHQAREQSAADMLGELGNLGELGELLEFLSRDEGGNHRDLLHRPGISAFFGRTPFDGSAVGANHS